MLTGALLLAAALPASLLSTEFFTVDVDSAPYRLSIRAVDGSFALVEPLAGDLGDDDYGPAAASPGWLEDHRCYDEFSTLCATEHPAPWTPAGAVASVEGTGDGRILRLGAGGATAVVTLEVLERRVLHVVVDFSEVPGTRSVRESFLVSPTEHYLGFGERYGKTDKRGETLYTWAEEGPVAAGGGRPPLPNGWNETYFPVPFFLSTAGYGVYVVNSEPVYFEMGSRHPEAIRMKAYAARLEYFVFVDRDPYGILDLYTARTGRPPVPPDWVFAPWNDAVRGEAEVNRVAGVLRDHRIPSSAIWTEDWALPKVSGDFPFGGYEVDRALYPNLESLAAGLHARGFKYLGYYRMSISTSTPQYAEGRALGTLVTAPDGTPETVSMFAGTDRVGFCDYTNPQAAEWMKGILRRGAEIGFDGWMWDFGEYIPSNALFADGTTGWQTHNRYPLLGEKLAFEALQGLDPSGDWLFFSRAGFAGSQRFLKAAWAGDQTADWDPYDGIGCVVPAMTGIGISGVPFFGSDIGGYGSFPPSTQELFFRWTELGALSPIMRTHHGWIGVPNWSFDRDAATLDHFKRYATLHSRLLPYFQAYAREAESRGAPIARHLYLEYPDDPASVGRDDEYLLGRELLVAPVVVEGATSREVDFPEGGWVDWRTGRLHRGPARETIEAPLSEIPLFLKQGGIVPMIPAEVETLVPVSTGETISLADRAGDLILTAAAGGAGSFALADGGRLALEGTRSPGPRVLKVAGPEGALPRCGSPAPGSGCWSYRASPPAILVGLRSADFTVSLSGPDATVRLEGSSMPSVRNLLIELRLPVSGGPKGGCGCSGQGEGDPLGTALLALLVSALFLRSRRSWHGMRIFAKNR